MVIELTWQNAVMEFGEAADLNLPRLPHHILHFELQNKRNRVRTLNYCKPYQSWTMDLEDLTRTKFGLKVTSENVC